MSDELVRAVLTVLFGALAGGITNTLAIWMLFHPYEPPRLFGRPVRRLQGAIPKNKARLAVAIGRTVGTRLLTPEDLARTVAAPSFREAFDERLRSFLTAVLEQRRGSFADELPAAVVDEIRRLLEDAGAGLLERLDAFLEGDEFRTAAHGWAAALARELEDQPLSGVLTRERESAVAEALDRWIAEVVSGPALERAAREYVDRTAERLLRPEATFQDLVPPGLVAAFERAVAGYLPLALERLGGLLDDPRARLRVQTVLHEVLDRFMRDLRFHQRLVAALIITPETVDRVLEAIEEEGAEKIAELLHDPAVRDAMARGVNDAVVDFLRRPVTEVVGRAGEPSVEAAKATLTDWAVRLARETQTRSFLVERLQNAWAAAERRTWGDLFRQLPPDRIADAVVAAARSEEARPIYREAVGRLVAGAMSRPLGRPAEYLPPDAAARIERALADPLWSWVQEQVPPIAQRVDIAGRVEEKILEYPTARLEELIRSVTERELTLIVRLGYVLGAFIGMVLVTVNLLVG